MSVHAPLPGFDPANTPQNAMTRTVLKHPRVAYFADGTMEALVLTMRDEVLVLSQAPGAVKQALIGRGYRSLTSLFGGGRPDDVELWYAHAPAVADDSIHVSRDIRVSHPRQGVPYVSPNHVCAACPNYDICPGGHPHPIPRPPVNIIEPVDPHTQVAVVVIDTGYIEGNDALGGRGIISSPAKWFDSMAGTWKLSEPDNTHKSPNGTLPEIAGHGTFVAGIVAAGCRAKIGVLGLRHGVMTLASPPNPLDAPRLFTNEFAVASALSNAAGGATVISCGFAFPSLDDEFPAAITAALHALPADAPAVVAPAGNEDTSARYWPGAHPRAIAVGATGDVGATPDAGKADFSNFGPWIDCWAYGYEVHSTFVKYSGPTDENPAAGSAILVFEGWASWSGTSFATPKVAAAIANYVANNAGTPVQAFGNMVALGESPVEGNLVVNNIARPHFTFR